MIAHLVYDDMFERYGHYLKNIPAETDIIITTNTPEKEARLKELYGDIASVRLVTNRGRDMSALLVGCRDILMKYEFLCFVHDKKSSQKEFASVGAEFDRLNWENMLHSEGYIRNIIGLFKHTATLECSHLSALTTAHIFIPALTTGRCAMTFPALSHSA